MTTAQAIGTHLLAAWVGAAIGVISLALVMGARDGQD